MTVDNTIVDHMDYAEMTQNALRGVIRQALLRAANEGLPGEHHFYVTFLTRARGVVMPEDVLAKYPTEITIVLQHQYRDLKVFDENFHVTLSFGGIPRVLKIPFNAIIRFVDPSVEFALDFDFDIDEGDEAQDEADNSSGDLNISSKSNDPETQTTPAPDSAPKVVSLEQFRKK